MSEREALDGKEFLGVDGSIACDRIGFEIGNLIQIFESNDGEGCAKLVFQSGHQHAFHEHPDRGDGNVGDRVFSRGDCFGMGGSSQSRFTFCKRRDVENHQRRSDRAKRFSAAYI